jgi:hypothetical protein
MAITELLASAARTESGVGSNMPISNNNTGIVFLLTVTNKATEVGDTLDVYVQDSIDDGTTWDDVVHFTQQLGNGSDAEKSIAAVCKNMSPESELHAPQDAAMGVGVRQGPIGPLLRVKYVIADSGTDNATFTFGVGMRQLK